MAVSFASYGRAYASVKIAAVASIVALALSLLLFFRQRDTNGYQLRAAAPFLPLLGVLILSAFINDHRELAFASLAALLTLPLFAPLTAAGLTRGPGRTVIGLTLLFSLTCVSLIALAQRFTLIATPFDKYGAPDAGATLGLSNFVAAFVAPALFIAAGLLRESKNKIAHHMLWLLPIALAALLTINVRAAWLSLGAGIAALALYFGILRNLSPLRAKTAAACIVPLLILSGFAASVITADKLGEAHGRGASLRYRIGSWQAAYQIGKDNPLLGAGPGNFAINYPEHQQIWFDRLLGRTNLQADNPHSEPMRLWAEGGAAGLLGYALLLTVISWFAVGRRSPGGTGAFAAIAALGADGLVNFNLLQPASALILGLASAVAVVPRDAAMNDTVRKGGVRARIALALASWIFAGVYLFSFLPADVLRWQGKDLLKAEQYSKALAVLEEACNFSGKLYYLRFEKGIAALKTGDDGLALEEFEKTIDLAPQHGRAHALAAQLKVKRGEYREAIAHYEATRKYSPFAAIKISRYAMFAYDAIGNATAAASAGTIAYRKDRRPEIALMLSRNLIDSGSLQQALNVIEQATSQHGRQFELDWQRARALAAAGDNLAAPTLAGLLAAQPQRTAQALNDPLLKPLVPLVAQ